MTYVKTLEQHEALIEVMLDPARWPYAGGDRRRVDTHISTVLLAGDRAYKIKKPLDLGFLNFLDLDDREQACWEELRLNRRLAPQLYLDVVAITGELDNPVLGGEDAVIDWAVVMRRFDPDAILSEQLDSATPALLERLAEEVAVFHQAAEVVADPSAFGTVDTVFSPMTQNFSQIRDFLTVRPSALDAVEEWTKAQMLSLESQVRDRRNSGMVRECHGDLHLGNVALIDGEAVVFDAIEFNAGFRWIDVINDVAFMTMDLKYRLGAWAASRFLNRYLQVTGDFAGLALLRLYEVYRALVRAKIAAIRLGQLEAQGEERDGVAAEFEQYVELAVSLTAVKRPAIVMMRGVSGSGKSYVGQQIADRLPAVMVRSDVERKRLLGLSATADVSGAGGYDQRVTDATYQRLATIAGQVLSAGYVVVVDATFLKRAFRTIFQTLAARHDVPVVIVDCDAPRAVLEKRLEHRAVQEDNVSDADLSVVAKQWGTRDALGGDEADSVLRVTPDSPLDWEALATALS